MGREQLDDFLSDQGGIDVQDKQTPWAHPWITVPCATTVRPDSVTVKPRAMSASWSLPTRAPSSTTTFLSKMARCTCAWRPTTTSSSSTESDTVDHECSRTPGDRIEPVTVAPDTMTPGETTESAA